MGWGHLRFSWRRHSQHGLMLLAGVACIVLMVTLYILQPIFLTFLDLKLYDTLLRQTHHTATTGKVVVVDVDETTLDAYGQWPWPRYRVALLLARLQELGVAAVGLDMIFAEPDRTSPKVLQAELEQDLQVSFTFEGLPEVLLDNDTVLAQTLARGPFVLGTHLLTSPDEQGRSGGGRMHPLRVIEIRRPGTPEGAWYLLDAQGALTNLPVLSEAATASGFFSTLPDVDGVLRRTPLLARHNGTVHANLALATLLQALNATQVQLTIEPEGVSSLRVQGQTIPLDAHGRMQLHFRGPGKTFPYVSAADVLQGTAPRALLDGAIVFVGTSAAGLKDLRVSPLDPVYPGVEAHATMVDTILTGDFLSRPQWAPGVEVVAIVLCGGGCLLLLMLTSARWSLPPMLVVSAGVWFGARAGLSEAGMFFSPLYPVTTVLLLFPVLTLVKYLGEEHQRRFFQTAFSRYVSKGVMDQLVRSPEQLTLTGEAREVTIFFSDIRGFTSISENLSSAQVSQLLHAYFTPMTRSILHHSGTLDKYIGDAIMAYWNAPVPVADHAVKAVAASLAMQEQLAHLNATVYAPQFGIQLRIGVGLHLGTVMVGNMGSEDLFDYTIIGDAVNLASRVEGLTKQYGVELLVTEAVRAACLTTFKANGEANAAFVFQPMDLVRVKGKAQPVALYTVLEAPAAQARDVELEKHALAWTRYQEGRFEEAASLYAALAAAHPEQTAYALFATRCHTLHAAPPQQWDGVFTHTEK